MSLLVQIITSQIGLGAIVAASGFVGGFTRGISGFGAALIMVPLLGVSLSPTDAVVSVVLSSFVTNLPLCRAVRHEADVRCVAFMALGALVALPLGTWLLLHLDPYALRKAIGAVVIGSTACVAFVRAISLPTNRSMSVAAGAASGLLNGTMGLGGPPVVLYFLYGKRSATENRASFILYFTVLQTVQAALLAFCGVVGRDALGWTLVLIPSMWFGSYVGSRAFRSGLDAYFRVVTCALLAVTGLLTMLK